MNRPKCCCGHRTSLKSPSKSVTISEITSVHDGTKSTLEDDYVCLCPQCLCDTAEAIPTPVSCSKADLKQPVPPVQDLPKCNLADDFSCQCSKCVCDTAKAAERMLSPDKSTGQVRPQSNNALADDFICLCPNCVCGTPKVLPQIGSPDSPDEAGIALCGSAGMEGPQTQNQEHRKCVCDMTKNGVKGPSFNAVDKQGSQRTEIQIVEKSKCTGPDGFTCECVTCVCDKPSTAQHAESKHPQTAAADDYVCQCQKCVCETGQGTLCDVAMSSPGACNQAASDQSKPKKSKHLCQAVCSKKR